MSEELQKKDAPGALVPSFIDVNDRTGKDQLGMDELRLPRLAIAQGLSPQMVEGGSQYIPELRLTEMFNDLSSEIYGRGPLQFVVIRQDVRRIEFHPDDRNVVLDMNVPANDPRTQWTVNEKGERIPPRATKFVEFIVLLVREGQEPEPIVLSIKDTNKFNRKAIERLAGFVKFHPGPVFSAVYSVRTVNEKNDEGTFGVFVIDKLVSKDNPKGYVTDQALFLRAQALEESLRGKTVAVNREPGSDDGDTEFPPADDAPKM